MRNTNIILVARDRFDSPMSKVRQSQSFSNTVKSMAQHLMFPANIKRHVNAQLTRTITDR